MKKRLLIALCLGLLLAMGVCTSALAADYEMTTDGKLFSGQVSVVYPDPENDPDRYEMGNDKVWFQLDKPSKVELTVNMYGEQLHGRLFKIEINDDGEWDRELYWIDVDFQSGVNTIPKKFVRSTYLTAGKYYFEIWADWYNDQPLNIRYNLSVTASAVTQIEGEADKLINENDVRPVTLPAKVNEALFIGQYKNIYRFTVAQQSMVDISLTGANNTWVGMQVTYAEPNENEGEDTIIYDVIYDNDSPLYGEVLKPVAKKKSMFLAPGTYYVSVFRQEDGLSAPYQLNITAKAMPTAKLNVPKKLSVIAGSSTRIPLFGNAYDFGSWYEIKSSDSAVAFHEGGTFIKALKVGSTKLTVTITGQKKSVSCTVKVLPNVFKRTKPLTGKDAKVYLSVKSLQFTSTGIDMEVFVLNKTKTPISAVSFENFHLRMHCQNMDIYHADYSWDELTNGAKQPIAFAAPIAPGKFGTFKLSMKPHYEDSNDIQSWERMTADELNLTVSSDCLQELNGVQYFSDATIKSLNGGIFGAKVLTGKEKTSSIDEKAIFAATAK